MRGRRSTRAAATLLLVTVAVTGCSFSGLPDSGDSELSEAQLEELWAIDIALAKEKAQSDFEVGVFADDSISAAEYDEAVKLYVKCVQTSLPEEFSGFVAQKDKFGIYGYSSGDYATGDDEKWSAAYESADQACRPGTILSIEPLYVDRTLNPKRQEPPARFVDCFKRHGLVPDSYTVHNYNADLAALARKHGDNSVDSDPSQQTELDLEGPEAQGCMVTPWD